jgi:hypothetical protein
LEITNGGYVPGPGREGITPPRLRPGCVLRTPAERATFFARVHRPAHAAFARSSPPRSSATFAPTGSSMRSICEIRRPRLRTTSRKAARRRPKG